MTSSMGDRLVVAEVLAGVSLVVSGTGALFGMMVLMVEPEPGILATGTFGAFGAGLVGWLTFTWIANRRHAWAVELADSPADAAAAGVAVEIKPGASAAVDSPAA